MKRRGWSLIRIARVLAEHIGLFAAVLLALAFIMPILAVVITLAVICLIVFAIYKIYAKIRKNRKTAKAIRLIGQVLLIIIFLPHGFAGVVLALVFLFMLLTPSAILLAIPVRYTATVNTGKGSDSSALVKVNYLYWLFRAVYVYENGKSKLTKRVAWFELKKKEKKEKKSKEKERKEPLPALSEPASASVPLHELEHAAPSEEKSTGKLQSVKEKFIKIKSNIKTVLTYPNRKIIVKLVVNTIIKTVKTLRPKHFHISGTIGFNDPSKTGIAIGLYQTAAEMFNIRHYVNLNGNFDTEKTDIALKIDATGSVNILRTALPLLGLLTKIPIIKLIKDLLRKEG